MEMFYVTHLQKLYIQHRNIPVKIKQEQIKLFGILIKLIGTLKWSKFNLRVFLFFIYNVDEWI